METKTFETDDLYLSSVITTILKKPPGFKVVNGRTIFVYPISDELYGAMAQYNGGITLNAIELTQTIKRLRAEMMMKRNEHERGYNGNNFRASFR
jgi:hypothetical protein